MENLVPIHVGLMGHIDHGKTELARVLSEQVSTAGLDRHKQAQERGITIDLGFTMFTLGPYLVTLVDAPGHHDLIRSVVAGASIIDAAILVVAADEGPKVQTGEHVVALQSMGVDTILVAITKAELVDEAEISQVENRTRIILDNADFHNLDYVRVSAFKKQGIDQLKEKLEKIIEPKTRDSSGDFLMPIDHAFPIKGYGTIITGTIQRGSIKNGDTIELVPKGRLAKLRTVQTFGKSRAKAKAGDRVGLNIPDLDDREIQRGNYLCKPGSLMKSKGFFVRLKRNPIYHGRITKKMILSATIGMPSVTAEIVPYEDVNNTKVVLDEVTAPIFEAALLLQENTPGEVGTRVLLMRTDLPATQMRIIGAGEVISIPSDVRISRRKKRAGRVTRVRDDDWLIEGLASSKAVAESLSGSVIYSAAGVKGILGKPFGTRGVLSAIFGGIVNEGDQVIYESFSEEVYKFGP